MPAAKWKERQFWVLAKDLHFKLFTCFAWSIFQSISKLKYSLVSSFLFPHFFCARSLFRLAKYRCSIEARRHCPVRYNMANWWFLLFTQFYANISLSVLLGWRKNGWKEKRRTSNKKVQQQNPIRHHQIAVWILHPESNFVKFIYVIFIRIFFFVYIAPYNCMHNAYTIQYKSWEWAENIGDTIDSKLRRRAQS